MRPEDSVEPAPSLVRLQSASKAYGTQNHALLINEAVEVVVEAASTLKSNLTNGTQLQNELNILYAKVAALKQNRDSSKIINHLEAIMALMPLFLTTLVPVNERKAHIDSSLESFKYYLTRLKQNPTDSQTDIEWCSALTAYAHEIQNYVETGTNSNSEQMAKSKVKNNLSVEPKLEGNRWYIRRAVDVADSIVVKSESISQAVIIEDCKNSSIIIDGKVAALIIDSCSKLSVHFTHVVSNVELLKCENSKLFVQGMTPTIVMDDCEGIQVTLETLEAAKNSTILSSKCSEINVIVPSVIIDKNSADDDLVELPLPFQFKSRIDTTTGKLVTEAVEHIGA